SPVSDLRIYSVDGRQVRTVFRGVLAQGEQVLSWDGRDEGGRRADSGMYFARFLTRGRAETIKFLLVR
ncbi:MAG TPA: FlgD immunoglobulin-like domain containing protein, partial [Candidatus Saccharimonadales bacterium]|nr:FlgD immunoglobulin-like domain containing protein [Candidatus Saccharimonadales bacterium]